MNDLGISPQIQAGINALHNNPDVAEYLTGNGHRIATCRAMLDLLCIPYPAWAKRGLSGRAGHRKAIMKACNQDNPHVRY